MIKFENSLEFAKRKDREDVLRDIRERFCIQENVIYMDGNSLGLCSKDAKETYTCCIRGIHF